MEDKLDKLNHIGDGRILATKAELLAVVTRAVDQARREELEQLRYQFAILVGEIRVSDVLKTIDENLATLPEHKENK